MQPLGELLIRHGDLLVHRWYDRWRKEGAVRADLSEAVLKDSLPLQMRVIAEALCRPPESREAPHQLWQVAERLNPEQRLRDDVPIEETIREYAYVVDEIRLWLEEEDLDVPHDELAYVSVAFFELAAESARRYAKLLTEETTRLRSEYVAGIAHQMRTPLTVLKLQFQKLEREMEADHLGRDRLRRTFDRFQRLVNGLLRVERFAPHQQPRESIELSPAHLLQQIAADYEVDAQAKGLTLQVEADPSLRMSTDPGLLIDAVGNLVQNAIKYTRRGYVRVTMEAQGDEVMFRVEDSGAGISVERQRSLMHSIQKGEQGGVGLGLMIARHAAEALDGQIQLRSDPGQGSTFVVCLPRVVPSRE